MRQLKPEIAKAPLWTFLNDSINSLQASIPSAGYRKILWCYYYVQMNVMNSLQDLSSVDIDADFLRFPQVQKNNRIAIEAALDLFNLCKDPNYISVICQNAGISDKQYSKHLVAEDFAQLKDPSKYKSFCTNHTFYTLNNKLNIAKQNQLPKDRYKMYKAASQESNQYMHPNVFLSPYEPAEKAARVRDLLVLNLTLLLDSYHDVCVSLSNGWIFRPCPLDHLCHNDCLQCYGTALQSFLDLLDGDLFVDMKPQSFMNLL